MPEARRSEGEWVETTFGELTAEQSLRVGSPGPAPVVLSSTKHHGLVPSDEYFKNRTIYSDDLTNYKRVLRDWFAYATNHLAEGSIGRQKRFDDSCVSPIYTVFSCTDGVHPPYLERVVKSVPVLEQYKTHEQATVDRRGAVRYRDFARVRVHLPPPVEQVMIAEVLDTLDTTIRQTEAIIEKLKQVKQGLLHDLLTRGIDDNGELRPPQSQAPHLYKDSPLGWIPRAWTARPLAEIVATTPNAIVDGPFGSNLKSEHYRSSGIPVIQSGYVTSGEFRAESYVYVTLQHFQTQARSRVDPGDIVMAKIGANAGMCAVLPTRHAFGILAGNCMKITADDCVVRRDWLVRYLHRLYQVTGMSDVRTETAQPAISLGRIRKLLVPVPPNVEQERAALSLASIEESLRTEAKAASKMRELKSGLMDDLLTGRVRVTPPLA